MTILCSSGGASSEHRELEAGGGGWFSCPAAQQQAVTTLAFETGRAAAGRVAVTTGKNADDVCRCRSFYEAECVVSATTPSQTLTWTCASDVLQNGKAHAGSDEVARLETIARSWHRCADRNSHGRILWVVLGWGEMAPGIRGEQPLPALAALRGGAAGASGEPGAPPRRVPGCRRRDDPHAAETVRLIARRKTPHDRRHKRDRGTSTLMRVYLPLAPAVGPSARGEFTGAS